MNTQLKPRDVKLILILVVLVILLLPFFFIIQPQIERAKGIETEIKSLNDKVAYLEQLAGQSQEYLNSIDSLAQNNINILSRFPSELPQESNVVFIYETEQYIPIRLNTVTFGEDVAAQIVSDAEQEQIDEVEEMMGDKTDDEVIEESTEVVSLGGGLYATSTDTQFTFSARYNDFKKFLEYIYNYKDRTMMSALNISYSSEVDLVSGSFTLRQFAIAGEDRDAVQTVMPSMIQGTSNIFMQATGTYGQEQDAETTDFFLMLSNPNSEVDAKIIGRAQDPTKATYLTSDTNAQQEISITFDGEGGNYTAVYQIGKEKYEEPVEFTKDTSIIFEIISSKRVDDKDKVSAKVNIINHTDTTVTVSTVDDDEENPRVEIAGKTGSIIVK